MKARKRVVQGGTSAGKTHGIIPIEIDYCIKNPKTLTTFVAESIPAVKAGCVKIFKDVTFRLRQAISLQIIIHINKHCLR